MARQSKPKTPKTPKPPELTVLEQKFLTRWIQLAPDAPAPTAQFKFHPTRRWKFDFAWVVGERKIAVELEGGVYTGGRHTRAGGFIGDCDKYNAAVTLGWKLLRYTTAHLDNDPSAVIEQIRGLLA